MNSVFPKPLWLLHGNKLEWKTRMKITSMTQVGDEGGMGMKQSDSRYAWKFQSTEFPDTSL